jgi:hypothetical protein
LRRGLEGESGRAQPHSKTLPRFSNASAKFRQVLECGCALPLSMLKACHNIADLFHMAGKYGFTRTDALIVVLTMAIVGSIAFSYVRKSRQSASVSGCYANLRQIGGGFETLRIELPDSHVNYDRTAAGIFRPLSNVMSSPIGLVCPNDQRGTASSWSALSNSNVSYFVNTQVQIAAFGSILAGDRNINVPPDSTTTLSNSLSDRWSSGKGMHGVRGYVLVGDGHVEELDNSGLSNAVARAPLTTTAVP